MGEYLPKLLHDMDLKIECFNIRLAESIEKVEYLLSLLGGLDAEISIHDKDKR